MNPNLMTLSQARGFLRAAMETMGPEFVYNPDNAMCHYTVSTVHGRAHPTAQTGCLVGTALKLAGRTEQQLGQNGPIAELEEHFGLTHAAVCYFAEAQVEQDTGGSWGHAFDTAERQVSRLSRVELEAV